MTRPAVLHCSSQPADPLVTQLTRLATATRPLVAAGSAWPPARLICFALVRRARVLHAHDVSWAPVVARAGRFLGLPWAVTLHTGAEHVSPPAHAALTGARLVTARTQRGLDLAASAGVAPERTRLLVPGVELDAEGARGVGQTGIACREAGTVVAEADRLYAALARREPLPPPDPLLPGPLPHVSVVMSTLNRCELLARTLDALESQTYPAHRVEVVVVDNGSSDGTQRLLAGRRPPWRLTVCRNDTTLSAAESRNVGVREARGQVIAFTDDDCRPTSTWLECLMAELTPDSDIVQGYTCPDPAQVLSPLSRSQWTTRESGLYETCNIAYRRSALSAGDDGPFRRSLAQSMVRLLGGRLGLQAFGEDVELAWRVKRAGGGSRFSPTAVVHHHVFPPDRRYLWRRAALATGFPLLTRQVPELRAAFLWRRWFLGPQRPFVLLGLAGLVLAPRWHRAIALTGPWLYERVRPFAPGRRARLRAIPVQLSCDVIETAALVYGSVAARTVVL